jgi:hypothetical protein
MRAALSPLVFASAVIFVTGRAAAAVVAVQAPAGARPITLPDGLVACAPTAGEWTTDADPHVVHPPKDEAAIGHVAPMKVAASAAACAASTAAVDLVTTGRLPAIDAASVSLAVDEGRLDLRGRGLRGVGVHWQEGEHAGDDRCAAPESPAGAAAGVERCSFGVARGLPADAGASLSVFPAGGRAATADVATFDVNARRVADAELALRPARVVVASLVPPNVAIDLVGDASRIPLTHPEAVASVDCGAASCALEGGAIVVRAVRNIGQTLAVRVRLAPHVFFAKGDALDAAPQFQVGVLPCAMSVASGDVLRDTDDTRVVVKLDARVAAEAPQLRFTTPSQSAPVQSIVSDGGAAYVLLRVGRVGGEELAITALRGDTDASILGVARAKTRAAPQPKATLELEAGGAIDFIPTNRSALVRFAGAADHGRLALLPMEGAYEVVADPGGAAIRGLKGAAGFVALRFGYRVPTLPGALAATDLAVLVDPIERPLKDANVPAALGASAMSDHPLIELVCGDGDGGTVTIKPGTNEHIPYAARDTCRVVFHKERLSPADGAQRISLGVDVTRVDGETRPEAHIAETIVLRPGAEPRIAWIKGVSGPFDHVTVRVAHEEDEAHYVGADEIKTHAPSVQWSVIAGKGHARIYATTAIPTGLYRVSDSYHSGILALNFGVIARLTWLDSEGHEGFLGLEGGVMGVGLANDTSAQGKSLTQVATVTGIGLSVPIANRSLATETSINLHAWLEYEISRALGPDPGPGIPNDPLGFVFGPSISIGNIGTNL